MNIIIVGCGKMGTTLAGQLAKENHSVTVIDTDGEKVRQAAVKYDVMGIEGNGAGYELLKEAGIDSCDMLIAATQSDEINLLCCVIARKAGCKSVARVRSPIYSDERDMFQSELGISLVINPERSAAREIRRLIQYPSALEIDAFAGGKVELVTFRLPEGSSMSGKRLAEISELQKSGVLVCAAERNGENIIPNGDFMAEAGDLLSVISKAGRAEKILKKWGLPGGKINNVCIIGGSHMSYYLGKMLLEQGIRVTIVENKRERCEEISAGLPKASVIYGDGISREIYEEENLRASDAFVVATGVDEENIIFSLFAKADSGAKVITKISRPYYRSVSDTLKLDTLINPIEITSEKILSFVRASNNSMGCSNVESLYRLYDGRVEVLEFRISGDTELTGVPLKNMKLRDNTLIVFLIRGDQLIIPGGDDSILPGDSVVVATTHAGYQDIDDIAEKKAGKA